MAPQHPDEIRQQLLGYLLESLEPHERAEVEEALRGDPQLRADLALLRKSLAPLNFAPLDVDPPEGLAEATCEYVSLQAAHLGESVVSREPPVASTRWTMADLAVAAGVFLSATLLLFPAVQHSRAMARRTECQENLREAGVALDGFSSTHGDLFPTIPENGRLAAHWAYGPQLVSAGYLAPDTRSLQCPTFRDRPTACCPKVPTVKKILVANEMEYRRIVGSMNTLFAYAFGYYVDGHYEDIKNTHSAYLPVLSDIPNPDRPCRGSRVHGPPGQNVLFADGRVVFLTVYVLRPDDNIFTNGYGEVAAGIDCDDIVMGSGGAGRCGRKVDSLYGSGHNKR